MDVADILHSSGLEQAIVVAGKNGLHREVTSISVLEVSDKKIKTWVLEGQIYITSFYAIIDNIDLQKEVIQTLNEYKCSGLVICHIDLFLKKIHPDILALCDYLSFPLIIAKSKTSYIEIIHPILEKFILSSGYKIYESLFDLQNEIINYINSTTNPLMIYKYLSRRYNNNMIVFDNNESCEYSNFNVNEKKLLKTFKQNNFDSSKDCFCHFIFEQKKYIGKTVYSKGVFYAIIIIETKKNIDFSIQYLSIIGLAYILIKEKHQKTRKMKQRWITQFINDLITWNFRNDSIPTQYAREIGWTLEKTDRLVLINLNDFQSYSHYPKEDVENYIENIIYPQLKNLITPKEHYYLSKNSDLIILFVDQQVRNEQLLFLCQRIIYFFKEKSYGKISIGISQYNDLRDIPTAYKNATLAYRMGRLFLCDYQIVDFRDISRYKYLSNSKKTESPSLVEKLHLADPASAEELKETIYQMIQNNFEIQKVAARLYIHRNTVHYRLNKVNEILGYNPLHMPYLLDTLLEFIENFKFDAL